MKVRDLEGFDALRLGKWIIFNKDNTGYSFCIFYDGKEVENVTSFHLDVGAGSPITLVIKAYIMPDR